MGFYEAEKTHRVLSIVTAIAILVVFQLLMWPSSVSAEQEAELPDDQCVRCHQEMEILPEGFVPHDVHLQDGLSCAGCHGGDPTSDDEDAAMSPEAGFVGVPSKSETSAFCGKCHSDIEFMRGYLPRIPTDQIAQYATSGHGKGLAAGDVKVAGCVDCHTSHGILPASDSRSSVHALNVPHTCKRCHSDAEYMSGYGIRTDQFEKFAESVHGVALFENQDTGSPACNDCHGNHGASPPQVESIRQVCGHCHVNNMLYFNASTMAVAFKANGFHACEECHGNHGVKKTTDDMVGVGEESTCVGCHDGDAGYRAAEVIREHLRELVSAYEEAEVWRTEVHRKGMDDVEIGFLLQESHQNLIKARTLVHTFDPEKVGEMTTGGVAKARTALELAVEQVEEYDFRRRGFGLATIFITILIVALFLRIRQMEAK
ncbi:MAG: cytochrome c3 family protein [Candidatus Latescibacterota bacterium]|nr:MAG: cytochrome c3 family protein [Candidatus Latescibacterota bacterium]